MKKQYDSSLFDSELKQLDSELVWKNANNPELKEKLISDMNKIQFKSKFTKPLGYVVRFSAMAAVLLIGFMIVKQEIMVDPNSGSGSSTNAETEYPFDSAPIDGDANITISASEQNLIEGTNGNPLLSLTNESTIPRDLTEDIEFISGKPEIEATKINNLLLAKATYPLSNGESITVVANENTYGSIEKAKEALEQLNPNSEQITISNRDAILYNTGDEGSSELLILDDKYLYSVKGENNESALIKVAEQIHFSD